MNVFAEYYVTYIAYTCPVCWQRLSHRPEAETFFMHQYAVRGRLCICPMSGQPLMPGCKEGAPL